MFAMFCIITQIVLVLLFPKLKNLVVLTSVCLLVYITINFKGVSYEAVDNEQIKEI